MTKPIRVVIADDDEQIRAQVRKLVEATKQWKIVAEAATGRDAIGCVRQYRPELLLLDIEMPEMNGLQALKDIRQDHPYTRVVIVSGRTDQTSVRAAQKLGAQGYVAKRDLEEELLRAMDGVVAGGNLLSSGVSQERTMSTTKAHKTSATEKREATMTNDRHRDTAGMSASMVGRGHDQAARPETRLIRVLVVDDDPVVVKVLCGMLSKDSQINLIGSCGDVDTAVKLMEQQPPEIVLLDLGLPSTEPVRRPERGGWYVVDQLRRADSRVRVILCTLARGQKYVSEAWRKGIDGYVPKTVVDEELLQAIYTVHSGERYFSDSLGKFEPRCRGILAALSDTERDVFSLFVRDYSAKEIGEELHIEPGTVDTHKHNIRDKIGHQDGWKGVASEARKEEQTREAKQTHKANNTPKYSVLLSRLMELERKVFNQYVGRWDGRGYVGAMTNVETLAEAVHTPIGEVKYLMQEIRRKLNCHPDGWKGIAKDEGDID